MDAVERGRAAYDAKMRAVYGYLPDLSEYAVARMDTPRHPIDDVRWVPVEAVQANTYNPNFVAPPELKLLKTSILEDGWTQPIVASAIDAGDRTEATTWEVNDGFHRWLLGNDPHVSKLSGGLVPIAPTHERPEEERMGSTIRHNRARGSHHVLKMADIVVTLLESGVSEERIADMLGMDDEEIDRMRDRGDMLKRGSQEEFERGWVPG